MSSNYPPGVTGTEPEIVGESEEWGKGHVILLSDHTIERSDLWKLVEEELERAYEKHGSWQWGRHEFYAILLEEVEELWDIIKRDGSEETLVREMVQVVVMVARYAETGNRCSHEL